MPKICNQYWDFNQIYCEESILQAAKEFFFGYYPSTCIDATRYDFKNVRYDDGNTMQTIVPVRGLPLYYSVEQVDYDPSHAMVFFAIPYGGNRFLKYTIPFVTPKSEISTLDLYFKKGVDLIRFEENIDTSIRYDYLKDSNGNYIDWHVNSFPNIEKYGQGSVPYYYVQAYDPDNDLYDAFFDYIDAKGILYSDTFFFRDMSLISNQFSSYPHEQSSVGDTTRSFDNPGGYTGTGWSWLEFWHTSRYSFGSFPNLLPNLGYFLLCINKELSYDQRIINGSICNNRSCIHPILPSSQYLSGGEYWAAGPLWRARQFRWDYLDIQVKYKLKIWDDAGIILENFFASNPNPFYSGGGNTTLDPLEVKVTTIFSGLKLNTYLNPNNIWTTDVWMVRDFPGQVINNAILIKTYIGTSNSPPTICIDCECTSNRCPQGTCCECLSKDKKYKCCYDKNGKVIKKIPFNK